MQHSIVIVDDEEMILSQLSAALDGIANIHLATSGQTAIALSQDIKPDLILLDLGVLDIDGYDVIHTLKTDKAIRHIPIVVMLPPSHLHGENKPLPEGTMAAIQKPIDDKCVRQQVRNFLSFYSVSKHKYTQESETRDVKIRFKNMLNMLSEAVVISDANGRIELVNQFCLNLFGYTREEVIGQNVKIFTPPEIHAKHDEYIAHYNKTRAANLIGNPREVNALTKSGKPLIVELNLSEYLVQNDRYYLAVMRDVTEKRQTEIRLLKSARYDTLTGLNSIVALNLDLEKLTSTEYQSGYLYSVMTDIDDFQSLNLVLGTLRCDELLQLIADKLGEVAALFNSRAYRLMSDRFLIYGFHSTEQDAQRTKEKLVDALTKELDLLFNRLDYSISLTTVCLLSSLESTHSLDLKHQLEMILFSARKAGKKGQIVRAGEGSHQRGLQFAELRLRLSTRVDPTKFSIVLQPKVDMQTAVSSFEALLRWDNSHYPLLHLGDLIAAAEDTSAIIEIGYFVLNKVCEFLTTVPKAQRKRVFVNLSIRQLSVSDFFEKVLTICAQHGVSPDEIGFEVTESMVASDLNFVIDTLFQLKAAGFTLSIDDFGTGQSNLRYIHKLPISELKIDKSFIDDISDINGHYPLIEGIYYLARSMDLHVVAEGVETEQQYTYLKALGVDEIQGYFFYKPMPAEQCRALIAL